MAVPKAKHVPVILNSQRDERGRLIGLFTKERVDIILTDLRNGLPKSIAAGHARVSAPCLLNWLQQGLEELQEWEEKMLCGIEEEPTQHALFYLEAQAAVSEYWTKYLADIKKRVIATPKVWTELATFHERMNFEFYGRKETVNVNKEVKIIYQIEEVNGDDWKQGQVAERKQAVLPSGTEDDVVEGEFR